ncbi:MAG: RNA-directed DNA polymerase [Okeania sp. SIO2F4]|uniref:reverse transcriptase family protein n=1 Tax=Okeania sp. SIO2F4 TaxID=2607790 RepID=UPI0014298A92|nr:reverse transcriptase family protein [Okeania sp. SIO2F4]NES06543.1 RNA-directed DNA polymerase [Okeania sp. SIO2F4]
MTDRPRSRKELYARIREIGREEFILAEMVRYGFWPEGEEMPQDPTDEIQRRGELEKQLRKLRQENARLFSQKKLRQEVYKQRLAESRRKQQETKERRERERQERAEAWQEQKENDIIYLGEGVSGGLNNIDGNISRLESNNLPILNTAQDIATAIDITVGELRFLAFSRPTSTISHYIRFKIPKKTGGERQISAPMPRLKNVQTWILDNILCNIHLHEAAHGFRAGHSILTNAEPHVAADVIINFDLKDFFPSISYKRVKGLFFSLGYSEAAATILAFLCTEPNVAEVELDGQTYYVAQSERHLPQGSPASPAITNIICRRLDKRLSEMAAELGFVYTRYADDLTFSGSGDSLRHICNIFRRTESIVSHEGFTVNEEKTRIIRRKSSQLEVTGVVVNEFPTISRKELKKFRATLYQIEKDGLQGKRWGNSDDVIAAIEGFANFVAMVNPEKGRELVTRVKEIKQKYGGS